MPSIKEFKKRVERPKAVKNCIRVKEINERKFTDPRYRPSPRYTFLQYIRIAYKWAIDNYPISKKDLEMMLYLYGIGVFNKKEFNSFCMIITTYPNNYFNYFIKEGWIIVWREGKKSNIIKERQAALYVLSDKAKRLCDKIHRICVGEITISEDPRVNFMVGNDKPRINGYYMHIIKEMNKKVREEKKKKINKLNLLPPSPFIPCRIRFRTSIGG